MENSAGAPAGGGSAAALGASFDPTQITQAFEDFLASATAILEQDFADLPGQIEQAVKSVADSFKDPKTLLSTALSDLMTVFQDLADDFVKFAQDLASDILNLIATLLEQVVIWLTEPVSIPFVSNLYQALTGDQLSVLDLTCLLAAVPGTILLDVITGSPTVPDTDNAAPTGAQDAAGEGSWHCPGSSQGASCSATRLSPLARLASASTPSSWASSREAAGSPGPGAS